MIRSISKLHQKNKQESRENALASKELREIQKELGIQPEFKKREKIEKKEVKEKSDDTNEGDDNKEPLIGEWSVVESSTEVNPSIEEPASEERSTIKIGKPIKKQSAGDLEVKNWDINKKKQIDTSLSDSDQEDKPKFTLFKKRKIKK